MPKLTLSDISSESTGWSTTVNANQALTETALENTLSRDGTGPNEMAANIDMNGYKLVNVAQGTAGNDVATIADVQAGVSTTDTVLSINSVASFVYPLTTDEIAASVTSGIIDSVSGWQYRPGDPRRYSASVPAGIVIADAQGYVLFDSGADLTLASPLTITNPVFFAGGKLTLSGAIAVTFNKIHGLDSSSLVEGSATVTYNDPPIAIGIGAGGSTDSIAIGSGALANSLNGVSIGQGSNVAVNAERGIAIGDGATASDTDVISIGTSAACNNASPDAIAIGTSANVDDSSRGVAIGYNANVDDNFSVALGSSSTCTVANSIAAGTSASVTQPGGVAVGQASSVTATSGVAVGFNATATASNGVAIGVGATCETSADIAIGGSVTATGAGTIAIGVSEDTAGVTAVGPGGNNFKFGADGTALADAALDAETVNIYLNEAGNTLVFKVKYADGTTVKSGTVALT